MSRRERRRPAHAERRRERRVPAVHVPSLSAQLSGGALVRLLDVSQEGVRLETTRHMRPGQLVSVRFAVDDRVMVITAAVVRAAVVHVHPEEVRYETGLRLRDTFSCEALDIALLERRGSDAESGASDEDEAETALVFDPAPSDEPLPADLGRGWWLASRRRRPRIGAMPTAP